MPIKVKGTEIIDDDRNIKNANGVLITGIVTTATQGSGGIIVTPSTGNVTVSYATSSFWVQDSVGINTSDKVGIEELSSCNPFGLYDDADGFSNPAFNNYSLLLKDSLAFRDGVKIGVCAGQNVAAGSGKSSIYIGFHAGKDSVGSDNYLIGYCAGSTSTGSFNIAIGSSSGRVSVGSSNVLIGIFAGECNKSNHNIFIGEESGRCNSLNSNYTIAIGSSSGKNNCGAYNIFSGNSSGEFNTGSYNISIGSCAGQCNNQGSENILIGTNSGKRNKESYNIFIGQCVGFSNCSPGQIFIGNSAGPSNTTGQKNIFIGNSSGFCNSIGSYNIFLGAYSGCENINGSDNIFLGQKAGMINNGCKNIFLGAYSGVSNSSGNQNIFLGYCSGCFNTIGSNNTYVGNQAGISTITSRCNQIFIGSYSGYGSRGSNGDIIIGFNAGCGYYSGSNNVFIGSYSGSGFFCKQLFNHSSHRHCKHNNIFVGSYSGSNTSNSNLGYVCNNIVIGCKTSARSNTCENILIGRNLSITGCNNIRITNALSNDFNDAGKNNVLLNHEIDVQSGDSNVIIGGGYLSCCVTDAVFVINSTKTGYVSVNCDFCDQPGKNFSCNVMIGHVSASGESAKNNIFLGYHSASYKEGSYRFTNYTKSVVNFFAQSFYLDRIGQTQITAPSGCKYYVINSFSPDGQVDLDDCGIACEYVTHKTCNVIGIGNTATTNFYTKMACKSFSGVDVNCDFCRLYAYTSSRRFKTNIRPFLGGIKETLKLNPVTYNSIEKSEGRDIVGFIAEEVDETGLKDFVTYDENNDPLSVSYDKMVSLLTNTIKELNAENKELNDKISEIENTFNNHI